MNHGGFAVPNVTCEYQDEAERLVIEQAVAVIKETRQLAANAPFGQVIACCEGHVLNGGRELLRNIVQ